MQSNRKWSEIYLQLRKNDKENLVEPDDLENFALAAYLTGRDAEGFQILERAHRSYLEHGKMVKAVRSAFWLGLMHMNAGQRARGSGWISRGQSLLSDNHTTECSEKGLFLIPQGLGALSTGQSGRALEIFEQATTIGEHFGDMDLIVLGRLGCGQALIQQGEMAKGVKLLDETMIDLKTEKVFPVVCGIAYCAVIETCRKVWDLKRAQEWTVVLTRWCESQPDLIPFRGQCLARRAEIIQFYGEWNKALEESRGACELLTRPPGEPAAGEAFYRKAELLRLLGDFEEAEDSYREAAKWGRNPQPGLALLRLIQGQGDAAKTSIINTLIETKDAKKRAELLPAVVRIMLAVKQPEKAMEATGELCHIANEFDVPYLHAISSYCRGAVSLEEGYVHPALDQLQTALSIWNAMHLPYETAITKELKGLAYLQLNDKDNSAVELSAAKWIFEQLQAIPDLERINRLVNQKHPRKSHGLTLREVQVLRLVASGKTNKSIADQLFISERTVDRHVSNIFNKLGVSSRVEATVFAIRTKLLDIPY